MIAHDEMVEVLRAACAAAGGQRAWAHAHGVSYRWVNNVLRGSAKMSAGICNKLGYRKVNYV